MSIRNVARIGKFSSDRSIEDYATKIWHIERVSHEGLSLSLYPHTE